MDAHQSTQASTVMQKLHGTDIYAGFVPMLARDTQGWNSTNPIFGEIIADTRPTIVVDVGVWKGGSTINLAKLLIDQHIDGVVIAVDIFLGSVEHNIPGGVAWDMIPRQFGRPLLYEQFLANVVRAGMQDTIVPMAQASLSAARSLKLARITPGLIHIDAAHDYESVIADIRAYWAILAPGGWLVGDDYSASWPGVMKAADEFAAELGATLTHSPAKWALRKPC